MFASRKEERVLAEGTEIVWEMYHSLLEALGCNRIRDGGGVALHPSSQCMWEAGRYDVLTWYGGDV